MDEQDPAMKGSEAEMARGIARLSIVTESLEYWIDEMQPDLVIRSNDIPPISRSTRRRRVAMGRFANPTRLGFPWILLF